GVVMAVQPSGNTVWVGTSAGLLAVDASGRPYRRLLEGSPIRTLHVDRPGTVWAATQRNLVGISSDGVRVLESDELRQIDAITTDPAGGLFVYDAERRLLRWTPAEGFTLNHVPDALRQSPIIAMHTASDGRVYFALGAGGLAVL